MLMVYLSGYILSVLFSSAEPVFVQAVWENWHKYTDKINIHLTMRWFIDDRIPSHVSEWDEECFSDLQQQQCNK